MRNAKVKVKVGEMRVFEFYNKNGEWITSLGIKINDNKTVRIVTPSTPKIVEVI